MKLSKVHALKILPEYFKAVSEGFKTFEIRKNDRDYKVGEYLILDEFNGENYTGKMLTAKINYMTNYEQKEGNVVLGIQLVDDFNTDPVGIVRRSK